MNKTQKPGFTYQNFAADFTCELFNATEWAEIFSDSGAQYVVLTSKHHEGYTLYPSSYSFSWNSVDVGPNRDIIKELSQAVRDKSMKFGIYYSLFEWFNRMYLSDKLHGFLKQTYVNYKMWPELVEIIDRFNPEIIWSDGDWEAPDEYWKAKEFLAWLYNSSPVRETVVTNDRWGLGTNCKHGDFYTCSDRFNPGTLQKHKFENAMTIDKESWGHRNNAKLEDFLTSAELIRELVTTVAVNGNLLVNVGPTKYGTIEAIFAERLRDMGKWLRINGKAIYGTRPWDHQSEGKDIWYTKKVGSSRISVFVFVLEYPYDTNTIVLKEVGQYMDNSSRVTMLGYSEPIDVSFNFKVIFKFLTFFYSFSSSTRMKLWRSLSLTSDLLTKLSCRWRGASRLTFHLMIEEFHDPFKVCNLVLTPISEIKTRRLRKQFKVCFEFYFYYF